MSPLRSEKSEDATQLQGLFSTVTQGHGREGEREVDSGKLRRHFDLEGMSSTYKDCLEVFVPDWAEFVVFPLCPYHGDL